MVESGLEAGRLAEVAAELDDPDGRVALVDRPEQLVGPVAAAVVDIDDLVCPAGLFQDGFQPPVHFLDVSFLVIERDDDGNLGMFRIALSDVIFH